MSEPRIPMLTIEAAREAATSVKMPEATAELNIFRVLLRHPWLAKHVNNLVMNLIFRGKLDGCFRELNLMRFGWSTNSL